MSPTLHIHLFGDFSIAAEHGPISGISSERLQALLAYLLLHRAAPQSRQQVAAQLWPEVADSDAKANLRRRLHELKQQIPGCDRWLQVTPKTLHWRLDAACKVDVAEFDQAITQAQTDVDPIPALEQAAKLYRGDLLLSGYDDWLVPYREKFKEQAIAGLDQLVTRLTQTQAYRPAISYAQQLLRIDPLYEPGYCHLMRLHAQMGDRASALRAYHQCMTMLQEELGVNPSPTTCKLYEDLLLLEEAPPPPICTAQAETAAPVVAQGLPPPQPLPTAATETLPLIGRTAEWATIQHWQAPGQRQHPSEVLLLLGETGIGKTRLLEELAQTVQDGDGYVLWGRAFEAEMLRPYGVWIDIFQSIGATSFLEELKSLVLHAESAAALNRGKLFDLATQFLTQLAETAPVLVILDDIQWLDEASIAFLHYAFRLLGPPRSVRFACAARQQELQANLPADRLLQALHREHRIRPVSLAPLDRSQTLALAQAAGCKDERDRIFTGSGGNPLFTLELARAQPSTPNGPPATLETLIQGRLRQLDESTQELIPWAAALGHSFNPTMLATVAGCPLPRLLNAIAQLEQHGIISPGTAGEGEVTYDFAHDIVRQVAYGQFSEPRRCLIHTHIAQALNPLVTPTSSLMSDVAHHADLGSDHVLAAEACLRAAERCLRIFAYAEAAELSQRGLRHCQYLAAEARILCQAQLLKTTVRAGVAKEQVGNLRQELQTLIQEAAALGHTEAESIGLEALISLNYDHGNLREVQQYSLRAAERGRIASPATTLQMLAHSGSCLAEIGREMARAEALLMEAQSMGDRLGLTTIDIPFGLGCVRRFQGLVEEARSHLLQGWQMAQTAQDHWRECTCLSNLVMLELETGNSTQALEYGHELIHVSAQMGGGSEAAHAAALDAVTHYLLQENHAAAALEQACQVLQQIDSPRLLAYVQTLAAQGDLQRGELQKAVTRAEIALEAAQIVSNPSEIALAWAVIIQAGYQRGNLDCARKHFSELQNRVKAQLLSAQAQQQVANLDHLLSG